MVAAPWCLQVGDWSLATSSPLIVMKSSMRSSQLCLNGLLDSHGSLQLKSPMKVILPYRLYMSSSLSSSSCIVRLGDKYALIITKSLVFTPVMFSDPVVITVYLILLSIKIAVVWLRTRFQPGVGWMEVGSRREIDRAPLYRCCWQPLWDLERAASDLH
jgi:hypothetical protein